MSVGRVLSKVLFWNYPRGGWQYDIVSALILAFIFLTPKSVFDGSLFRQEEAAEITKNEEEGGKQSLPLAPQRSPFY